MTWRRDEPDENGDEKGQEQKGLYVVLLVIWVSELHGATIMPSLVACLDTGRFKDVKYMACEPFAPTIRTF